MLINSSSGSSYFPEVEQLILGQISANMPVFNGFKTKYIAASEKLYEAAKFNNKHLQSRTIGYCAL